MACVYVAVLFPAHVVVPPEKKQSFSFFTMSGLENYVNREIFAALKVGEFAFFQLAVDKIRHLLQKFNG
jgi:hypothetical protein